jgi:hypothetical protein
LEQLEWADRAAQKAPTRKGQDIPGQLKTEPLHSSSVSKETLFFSRLLKNGHLLRFPHPSALRRTAKYASHLRISGALHLALFEQPGKDDFFSSLLEAFMIIIIDRFLRRQSKT